MKKFLNIKNVFNFGIEVKSDKFKFYKNHAILPNSLAISYALSIAYSGKAKRILLAGFDGYASDDPRTVEMNNTFDLFRKSTNKVELLSITPTRYNLKSISIYAI